MMKKAIPIPYVMIIIPVILLLPDASYAEPRAQIVKRKCSNQVGHNTTVYVENWVAGMGNIRGQIQSSGFGMAVAGTGPDNVYGLAQCHGDLSLADCASCFSEGHTVLPRCFPMNGGRVYLDGCFMRSEIYNFYQEFRGPDDEVVCGNKTRQDSAFLSATRQALSETVSAAPSNNGYARAEVALSGRANVSAYALANCWRTINASECLACLENASASLNRCMPSSEGRALNTGCFMRYSDNNFLNPKSRGGSHRRATVLASAFGAAAFLLLLAMIAVSRRMKILRQRREKKKKNGALLAIVNNSKINFSYETLENATNYFSNSNKLGQGGSGSVYKGTLPDGRIVAVKRLVFNTTQWADHFFNEVNLISGIDHKNLVKLLGCSITGPESLLVYEYVANQSLYDYLFVRKDVPVLGWEERYKIILGIAEGLAYLHESNLRIIHRDIKLSNVLLDDDFTAKIADFGLARLFPEDKTHLSTGIAGTLGYMAPEYIVSGKLTEKADVYSFGVVVTEVVCATKINAFAQSSYSILQKVWNLYGTGKLGEAVDSSIKGKFPENEANRLLQIGLTCVQADAELRPSMSVVVKMITGEHEISLPTQPPFLNSSSLEIIPHNHTSTYFQPDSRTQSAGNEINTHISTAPNHVDSWQLEGGSLMLDYMSSSVNLFEGPSRDK